MGFHAAQRFYTTYMPDHLLTYGLVLFSTVRNHLSENRCEIKEIEDASRKSKLASRHEGGKNMSPQKNCKLKPILIMLHTTF